MAIRSVGQASVASLCSMLLAVGAEAATQVDAQHQRYSFDIPKQSLSSALQMLALKSNHKLLYKHELTAGKFSSKLKQTATVPEALNVLLKGTGLSFEVTPSSVVLIRKEQSSTAQLKLIVGAVLAAGAATSPPASAAPQEAALGEVEQVVVTARRREESLQEVPIAITALSSEALTMRGIEETQDLNTHVPNLTVAGQNVQGPSHGQVQVRGIPGASVYVDGVVYSGAQGLLMDVVDIERIEVLRGPQGTLFGKNAIGGAIQFITRKPGRELGGSVEATAGSYDRIDVKASMDIPLGDVFFTKVTAAALNREGYVRSTTSQESFGGQEDRVLRLDTLWEPNDSFEGRLTGEYVKTTSNSSAEVSWGLGPVCAGDPLPARWAGSAPNPACVYQAIGLMAPGSEEAYGARQEWKSSKDHRALGWSNESKGVKADLTWRASDDWTVRSLTGFRKILSSANSDLDGTRFDIFQNYNANDREEFSEELQLLYSGERLSGTAGLYYYTTENLFRRLAWQSAELATEPYRSLAAAYRPGFGARYTSQLAGTDNKGWAAFTEWTYEVTDSFLVTLGLRYTEDDIEQATLVSATTPSALCCFADSSMASLGAFVLPNGDPAIFSDTFASVSPRVSLQYQWTPSVMTYLTYSEGFSAGGFNTTYAPTLPRNNLTSYDPSTLVNYEFGVRSDLFDDRLRLNVTYFFGIWEDIQLQEEKAAAPGIRPITNAGEAEIEGVEIESTMVVSPSFRLNASGAWLRAEYTDIGNAQAITLNSRFAYAPEYSFTVGGEYSWILGSGGALSLRSDYGWRDEFVTTLAETGQDLQDGYGLLGARLTYTSPDKRWNAALFGSNLTNEYYQTSGFFIPNDQSSIGVVGRPAEWGLNVGFSF
jgi:iron complex outermembrane recepter protein